MLVALFVTLLLQAIDAVPSQSSCELEWKMEVSPTGKPYWTHAVILDTVWSDPCVHNHNDARVVSRQPASLISNIQRYYDDTTKLYRASIGDTIQAIEAVQPLADWYSMDDVNCGEMETVLCPSNMHFYLFARLFENKVTQSAAILLDLGGGISGPACDWLANDPLLQVDSITISSVQNRIAEARIAKRDLSARARSILGDYHNLTSLVSSNAYDAAIAMETLGYSHNLTAVFEGVYRSLKPGGRFFLKEVCRPTMEFSQDEQKALDDVATVYGGYHFYSTGEFAEAGQAAGLWVTEAAHIDIEVAHPLRFDAAYLMDLFGTTKPTSRMEVDCEAQGGGCRTPPEHDKRSESTEPVGMAGLTFNEWLRIRAKLGGELQLNRFGELHTSYFDEAPMTGCYLRMMKPAEDA